MRRTKRNNIDPGKRAQRKNAVQGVLLFTAGQLLSAAVLLWARGLITAGWLDTLLLVLVICDLVTLPFSVIVLRQRIKEIERGELDEARKY